MVSLFKKKSSSTQNTTNTNKSTSSNVNATDGGIGISALGGSDVFVSSTDHGAIQSATSLIERGLENLSQRDALNAEIHGRAVEGALSTLRDGQRDAFDFALDAQADGFDFAFDAQREASLQSEAALETVANFSQGALSNLAGAFSSAQGFTADALQSGLNSFAAASRGEGEAALFETQKTLRFVAGFAALAALGVALLRGKK